MTFYTVSFKEFITILDLMDETTEDGIPVTELVSLAPGQRVSLAFVVALLAVLSVFGNVGTLFANNKRQLRPFFRTCLVSLALSDLILTVFLTILYLGQFDAHYVQVWRLGGFLCGFIPFVATGAILVSSMTLVGIAVDRYLAMTKGIMGFWNSGRALCCLCIIGIWGFSYGIASPMMTGYSIYEVYLLRIDLDDGRTNDVRLVKMCVSNKDSNAVYYVVVLIIIFVPTLLAFIWLNSIIANKLWIRRHSVSSVPAPMSSPLSAAIAPAPVGALDSKQMEMSSKQFYHHQCHCTTRAPLGGGDGAKICTNSIPTTNTTVPECLATAQTMSLQSNLKSNSLELADHGDNVGGRTTTTEGNNAKRIKSREARHLRMFTIVLILMAVFILFRLPAWIYLIMRLYGVHTRTNHWVLHFSFGILTLTSCALNPLLYTFLAETIQYAMILNRKLCSLRHFIRNGCGTNRCNFCKDHNDEDNDGSANDNAGYNSATDGAKAT